MSMPDRPEPAPLGTPDAYREYITDTAWSIGTYAELIQRYCALGDDAGLDYSIRCLVACTRSAVGTLADLKAMKTEQAERRAAASRPDPATDHMRARA